MKRLVAFTQSIQVQSQQCSKPLKGNALTHRFLLGCTGRDDPSVVVHFSPSNDGVYNCILFNLQFWYSGKSEVLAVHGVYCLLKMKLFQYCSLVLMNVG